MFLAIALSLGLSISRQSAAFAEATPLLHQAQPASTGKGALIAQDNLPTNPTMRPGKRRVADEVAQSSFEDEFGSFNLFIIFFVTLGPLKVIPVFMQVTQGASRALRRQLAFRSTAIATVVILLVVIIGQNLLQVWKIQLPALMIAGGLLLSLVALRLILSQYSPDTQPASPTEPPALHLAVTPLAFPTILPPFGIAIALTLMVLSTEIGFSPIAVMGLLLIVMGLNLISMLMSGPILKFIRPVTLRILGFTLGVMQFALGIQFVLLGLEVQALVIQILLRGQ
jgi:multiple antibiotic resistance protein